MMGAFGDTCWSDSAGPNLANNMQGLTEMSTPSLLHIGIPLTSFLAGLREKA